MPTRTRRTATLLPTLGEDTTRLLDRATVGFRRRSRRRVVGLVIAGGLLVAAVAGGTGAYAATTFSDVPPSHPFYAPVSWAADHGVVQGYPDGTYKPSNAVTRGSAAAIVSNYNAQIESVFQEFNVAATDWFSREATCPAGKRPVAGGGATWSLSFAMTSSYPTATGWTVAWETPSGSAETAYAAVWVTCVPTT